MTVSKAKVIFATHMHAARTRKLTKYELNQLSMARQTLRQIRKPTTNRPTGFKCARIKRTQENPKPVLIYGKVHRIEAVKTQKHLCDAECKAHGHRYFHNFKSSPSMYGMPDGSLVIK